MPLKSNAEAIHQADKLQDQTQEALRRIQQQAAQTEELGVQTLGQLGDQRLQAESIELQAVRLDNQLTKTTQLQNRLDKWAGRWGGRDKRAAKALVKKEVDLERQHERIEKEKKSVARTSAAAATATASSNSVEGSPTRTTTSTQQQSGASFAPPKKSKLLKKRPGKQPKTPEPEKLDAETAEGLERIAVTDKAIDSMLDQTAVSLDRIAQLTKSMGDETKQQNEKIDNLTQSLEQSNEKQRVVNNRVKRFLGGHWRKDSQPEQTSTSSSIATAAGLPPTSFM